MDVYTGLERRPRKGVPKRLDPEEISKMAGRTNCEKPMESTRIATPGTNIAKPTFVSPILNKSIEIHSRDENNETLSNNSSKNTNISSMSPIKRSIIPKTSVLVHTVQNNIRDEKNIADSKVNNDFKVPQPKKSDTLNEQSFSVSTQVPIEKDQYNDENTNIFLTENEAKLLNELNKINLKDKNTLLNRILKIESPIDLLNFCICRGYDINKADARGWTALHQSVAYNDIEIIEFLLKNGADCNFSPESPSESYLTPLEFSCALSSIEIIQLMISYGGNISKFSNGHYQCLSLIKCQDTKSYVRDCLIDARIYKIDAAAKSFRKGVPKYKNLWETPDTSFIKEDETSLNISHMNEFLRQKPLIFHLNLDEKFLNVIIIDTVIENADVKDLYKIYNLPADSIITVPFKKFSDSCYSLKESYITAFKENYGFKDDQIIRIIDVTTAFTSGLIKNIIGK